MAGTPQRARFPELNAVFEGVEYSYARIRTAQALAATAPDFVDRYALECLWDCEEETRVVGASTVDTADPRALARIRLLAGDRHEEPEVRAECRARLDSTVRPRDVETRKDDRR